jgi:hypothetical protein
MIEDRSQRAEDRWRMTGVEEVGAICSRDKRRTLNIKRPTSNFEAMYSVYFNKG